MPRETELYDRLEVPTDASNADIKKAYRKLAMRYHPDKNSAPGAEENFKKISEAYEVLSDDTKRSQYDQFGMDAFKDGSRGENANDIFSSFFGFGRPQGPRRTKDKVTVLNLSLEELYKGITKKMRVTRKVVCKTCEGCGASNKQAVKSCNECKGSGVRVVVEQIKPGYYSQRQGPCDNCGGAGETIPEQDKCKTCHGNKVVEDQKILKIEIDKGARDGKRVIFKNEADELPGFQAGDIIFLVKEKPHALFKRDGAHLYLEKEIPLITALTGAKVNVTHLDGRKLTLKTKEGDIIKPGDVREIPNEGMPLESRTYEQGNLYVKFSIQFPDKLSHKQAEALTKALPKAAPVNEHDTEVIELQAVDPTKAKQDDYKQGEAYEQDEEGNVRTTCAQQ